ncbi:type II toxin-antitoxin system HicA family toxin [Actinomadura decatromicini]|uniref:Type II toxin-antitoxin system HicA family toxin n=1 Tax=Actinomadura decatromicini TaxID=2604572 RepID=A0A5D3FCQ1_9ACTN|nr:type II toxin-antitoxin system HicA family toxin [Actinomadura decatromicini]
MPKAMRLWDLNRALQRHDCEIKSDRGRHTKWICPCGEHSANVPRHRVVSAGVVRGTIDRMACLPEGWLQ